PARQNREPAGSEPHQRLPSLVAECRKSRRCSSHGQLTPPVQEGRAERRTVAQRYLLPWRYLPRREAGTAFRNNFGRLRARRDNKACPTPYVEHNQNIVVREHVSAAACSFAGRFETLPCCKYCAHC